MLLCQSLNLNRIVNLIWIYIYIYNIVYQHRLLDLLKRDDTLGADPHQPTYPFLVKYLYMHQTSNRTP